jgi:hypothetical protein
MLYISFLSVYLLLSIGFSIAHHLCGDFVIDISVNSTNKEEPDNCCGEPCTDDCCKTEFKTIKIDDFQFGETKWELNSYDINFVFPVDTPDQILSEVNLVRTDKLNNSPPGNKTYLLNNTFLI